MKQVRLSRLVLTNNRGNVLFDRNCYVWIPHTIDRLPARVKFAPAGQYRFVFFRDRRTPPTGQLAIIMSAPSCRRTSQSVLWLSQAFMPA